MASKNKRYQKLTQTLSYISLVYNFSQIVLYYTKYSNFEVLILKILTQDFRTLRETLF